MNAIDWTKVDWTQSDTALAAVLGCTRQNVSAARARHDAPASPEQRGGDRKTMVGDDDAPTVAKFNTTKGQKRRWHEAHKAMGKDFDSFANAALDAFARRPKQ